MSVTVTLPDGREFHVEPSGGGLDVSPLDTSEAAQTVRRLVVEGVPPEEIAAELARQAREAGDAVIAHILGTWPTIPDVARARGVSRHRVHQLVKRGRLAALKNDGEWRVKPD